MAILFTDGNRTNKYLDASGTGTEGDPFRVAHIAYPAPTAEITASLTSTTTAGSIAAGALSISLANTGSADATVLGQAITPGVAIDFVAPVGYTLGAITYDASGSELLIQELRP